MGTVERPLSRWILPVDLELRPVPYGGRQRGVGFVPRFDALPEPAGTR
jgi:hypothetical protein